MHKYKVGDVFEARPGLIFMVYEIANPGRTQGDNYYKAVASNESTHYLLERTLDSFEQISQEGYFAAQAPLADFGARVLEMLTKGSVSVGGRSWVLEASSLVELACKAGVIKRGPFGELMLLPKEVKNYLEDLKNDG